MPSPHPRIVAHETLHKGRKFDFERLTVQYPSGRTLQREIVRHPGAVVLVPILPNGRIVLIRVFRISIAAPSVECCAGTIEPAGENPADCAARELTEETGFRAQSLVPLNPFYVSTGMTDERMHPFVAVGLTQVGQDLEDDEHIEVFDVTPAEAFAMIERGEIRDGKTMVALWLARSAGRF